MSEPARWRPFVRRLKACGALLGVLVLIALLFAFLLIPVLFRSDRHRFLNDRDDERDERREIYGEPR